MTVATAPCPPPEAGWLPTLRRYIVITVGAHLVWQFAHLLLYTIRVTGTAGDLAFAALHRTGGDLLIALGTISLALVLFGETEWRRAGLRRVLSAAASFGAGHAIISKWLNLEVRQARASRDLMPVSPAIDAGFSRFLQWLVVPTAGYLWAIRRLPWQICPESANA